MKSYNIYLKSHENKKVGHGNGEGGLIDPPQTYNAIIHTRVPLMEFDLGICRQNIHSGLFYIQKIIQKIKIFEHQVPKTI